MFLALKQLACEPGSQRKACKQASKQASERTDTMSSSRVTSRSRVLVLITHAQLTLRAC